MQKAIVKAEHPVTITFEDHGQDFLTFVIDPVLEKVTECAPFQQSIWEESECKQKVFEVGGFVSIKTPRNVELTIKYPIERIEFIQPDRVFNDK